jgi:hypothetical protein
MKYHFAVEDYLMHVLFRLRCAQDWCSTIWKHTGPEGVLLYCNNWLELQSSSPLQLEARYICMPVARTVFPAHSAGMHTT